MARNAGLCAMFAVLGACLAGCGWHVGSPPVGRGLTVGEVAAPVPEPGVADALRAALGASVRRRGAGGPVRLDAVVEEARFSPATGATGTVGAWTATLRVRFQRLGPDPHAVVLSRDLVVAAPDPTSSAGLPEVRAAAFGALAGDLAEEAVEILLIPGSTP